MQSTDTQKVAFEAIVNEYQQKMYWHIRKMVLDHDDAHDVLQNTFIKVWKALPKFRGDSKLYTWLYRIATNESLNHLRSQKKTMADTDEIAYKLTGDAYFDGDEIQAKLYEAIATLPEKQKAVFNLKYFEEMKYEEMSDVLETSVGALKASYHHAVNKIKAYLTD